MPDEITVHRRPNDETPRWEDATPRALGVFPKEETLEEYEGPPAFRRLVIRYRDPDSPGSESSS